MSGAVVAAYRAAIHLYPRRFRSEYGPDLVQLLEQQLRDESTARVVGRVVVDLAVSLPTQHLEAHMKHPSSTFVTLAFSSISVAALTAGLVIGSNLAWFMGALGVAAVTAIVAASSYRRNRPITVDRPVTAYWWKLLVIGPAMIAAFAAVTTATGELPENGWYVGMLVLLTALVTTAAGIVLAVARLAERTAAR